MQIRQVQPDDLAAIMQIEEENFVPEEAASLPAMRERIAKSPETFLVMEAKDSGAILGYVAAVPTSSQHLTDDLFDEITGEPKEGGYLAILSLSVLSDVKGQGIGTMLLAALKDVAINQKREGIVLTCHPELVPYYALSQFQDVGESASNHGGSLWIEMLWTSSHHK